MTKPITKEKYEEVKKYYITHKYQKSFTKHSLADKFGLSRGTIWKIIDSHGYANYLNKYTAGGSRKAKEQVEIVPPTKKKPTLLEKIKTFFHK